MLATFREKGFVVARNFLCPAAVGALRREFERVYAALHPSVHDEWVLAGHQHVGAGELTWLWALATHPALLDAVSAVLGASDVVLFSSQLATKRPGEGTEVPWHQDGERCQTVWIPIDDVSERMGALRVLPGMHTRGRLPFKPVDYDTDVDAVEFFHSYAVYETDVAGLPAQPESIPVPAGGIEIHHPSLPHASGPNRSRHTWRRAVILRYQPASEPLESGEVRHWRTGAPFAKVNYLVRGAHPMLAGPPTTADEVRAGGTEAAALARRPGGDVWVVRAPQAAK